MFYLRYKIMSNNQESSNQVQAYDEFNEMVSVDLRVVAKVSPKPVLSDFMKERVSYLQGVDEVECQVQVNQTGRSPEKRKQVVISVTPSEVPKEQKVKVIANVASNGSQGSGKKKSKKNKGAKRDAGKPIIKNAQTQNVPSQKSFPERKPKAQQNAEVIIDRLTETQKALSVIPAIVSLGFDTSASMSAFPNAMVCYNSLKAHVETFERVPLIGSCLTFGEHINVLGQEKLFEQPFFKPHHFERANLARCTRLYDAIIEQVNQVKEAIAMHSHPDLPSLKPIIIVLTDGLDNASKASMVQVKRALDSIAYLKPELMFGGFPPMHLEVNGKSLNAEEELRYVALTCGFPIHRIVVVSHQQNEIDMTESMNQVMTKSKKHVDRVIDTLLPSERLAPKRTTLFDVRDKEPI
jgi:hypothetical protein